VYESCGVTGIFNGIVFNGIVFNGIVFNDIVFNGIKADALSAVVARRCGAPGAAVAG
jgi:hypothetical protein